MTTTSLAPQEGPGPFFLWPRKDSLMDSPVEAFLREGGVS